MPPFSTLIPQTVSRYRVVEKLDVCMRVVYKAHDFPLEPLCRTEVPARRFGAEPSGP
jgi:hypothetical protein